MTTDTEFIAKPSHPSSYGGPLPSVPAMMDTEPVAGPVVTNEVLTVPGPMTEEDIAKAMARSILEGAVPHKGAMPSRIKWRGLVAPVEVPTGDSRMFAPGKLTHRPTPLPLLARFSSGGHTGAIPVGRVHRFFDGPGGYWAEGDFLDPEHVPEVAKAVYMLGEGVMGPSVDLDQNFTVKMIDHPQRPKKKAGLFEEYNVIGITLVPMPAFHQVHLSVDSEPTKALLASLGINVENMPLFDVNSDSWRSWPIAPREYRFDADDAVKRIAFWAGVGSREPDLNKYASAFLWRNGSQVGDTMAQDSFRLPLVDIINGEPYLIYHAVYSAAALLSGGHGGLPSVPPEDRAAMVPVINEMYGAFADAFGDPNLKSPFLERVQTEAAIEAGEEEDCGCTDMNTFTFTPETNTVTTTGANGSTFMITVGEPEQYEFARRRNPKEPYGDVKYADPGYQEDGKKRYPLDSEEHCRAAWSYINMPKNAAKYSPKELELVKGRIKAALKEYGVDVSDDDSGEPEEMALASRRLPELQVLVAGAANSLLAPPAEAFADPKLKAPTRLTITEDGRVFGHLAQWKVCHVGIGNACVIAPRSKTQYSLFRVGTVLLDDGAQAQVGKITLGTGHANEQWGVMPSREHYDNTGWAAALVNVGEDKHGIWVSGVLTASMTPEKIVELRASPLSGDWRMVNGNLELIAALAVNNPGFPIYREQDGRAFSLVGVGVVEEETEEGESVNVSTEFAATEPDEGESVEMPVDDVQDDAAELSLRLERLAAIDEDLEGHLQDRRAAAFAAIAAERDALPSQPASGPDLQAQVQMRTRYVQIAENESEKADEE